MFAPWVVQPVTVQAATPPSVTSTVSEAAAHLHPVIAAPTTSEEDEAPEDELSDDELFSLDEELLPSDEELFSLDDEEFSFSEEELFTLDDELDFSSLTPDEDDEEFSELLEDSSCKELISGFGFAGVHESSSPQARNSAHAHAPTKHSFKRFIFILTTSYQL
jgi:hypothetical protein